MKFACPVCKRTLDVTPQQVGRDVACPCGIAFTLDRQMYSEAANRRRLLVAGIVGAGLALFFMVTIVLTAKPSKKPAAAEPREPVAVLPVVPVGLPKAQPRTESPAGGVQAPALPAPIAWWTLDETAGRAVADSAAGGRRPGTLAGSPVWAPGLGVHGGALALNGSGQYVKTPALNLNSNTVTLTAWIRQGGTQVPDTGILFCRGGGTAAGILTTPGGELRYMWADKFWTLSSRLLLPKRAWTFVALAVEKERGTLYMGSSTGLHTFVNQTPHAPETFGGEFRIGCDPSLAARYFNGMMDDVRVYDRTLTAGELQELYRRGREALKNNPNADSAAPTAGGSAADFFLAPAATAAASIPARGGNYTADKLADGDRSTFFWSEKTPAKGSTVTISFKNPVQVSLIKCVSGTPEKPGSDTLRSGILEISADGMGFRKVAEFVNGTAQAALPKSIITAARITVSGTEKSTVAIQDLFLK